MNRSFPLFAMLAIFATPVAAQDCADGQRLFSHAAGETCIPQAPQRIAAPRGDSVATPLIDIGAPIIAAGFRTMEDGSKYLRGGTDILGAARIDSLGLVDLGNPNAPDMEVLANVQPDLIILTDWQAELMQQASAIAPTIVAPSNQPLLDQLRFLADASGMEGAFDDRLAQYQAAVADVRSRIVNPEEITISRLDIWEDGLWFYPNDGAVDQVIKNLGFSIPDIQAEATTNLTGISVERIMEFDGDIIITSTASRFGQSEAMLAGLADTVAPFWRQLGGVEAGEHYWYPRDVWGGSTFTSLEKALEGLALIAAGRSFN